MVRLKHRYLLVNILYPPTEQPPASVDKNALNNRETQLHLQICRPTTDSLTPGLLARMVKDTVGEMYGDWGMGKLGGAGAGAISVKYFSPATSTAIIRCPRAGYRLVWSALTYISRLPAPKPRHGERERKTAAAIEQQRDCVFRVVRVSGTMQKAEQEAVKRARMEVVRAMRMGKEGGEEVLEGMFGGQVDRGIESGDDGEENENHSDDESDG